MKFRVYSSVICFDSETDDFLTEYPALNNYGLEVVEEEEFYAGSTHHVKRAYITIDSIDRLLKLIEDVNEPIIIHRDEEKGHRVIEIYDGYRE